MNTFTGEIFDFYLYPNVRAVGPTQLQVQGTGILFPVTGRRMFASINQTQGYENLIPYLQEHFSPVSNNIKRFLTLIIIMIIVIIIVIIP